MHKEENAELENFITHVKDSRELRRALAVKMYDKGLSQKEIMELLSVSQPFVSKWNRIYKKVGIEGLRLKYKGYAGIMRPEARQGAIEWIKAQQYLTTKKLKQHLKEKYNVTYNSLQSYCILLAEAGYSHKKSQKVNPKRDDKQVKKKRQEIKKLAKKVNYEVQSGKRKIFF